MSLYLETALQVAFIWTLACCTPGANVLLTMNTALRYNRLLAIGSAAGVTAAVILWGIMGASGVLIILQTFPWLFGLLKLLGGSYLLYLGLSKIYSTLKQGSKQPYDIAERENLKSPWHLIRLAFFTSIVNPKTGLFVISLFSVAMPKDPSWPITILCVSIMGSITLLWHLFLACVFSTTSAQTLYQKSVNLIDYLTGGLFTLFGIKIIAS
ncbi:LysE family translocator [Endozoicomonas elysicola]|uniref:Lysine transporter LysE n=1 Tax=Endozoicomonas elysicola TaxID=305900 RepID=A0A081KFI3_9GAMM|nr:LysE family transporter [Endozoicomonas elysicola]KEI72909.1 hypothetical protein GV64_21230 [Endozoicomonas elysicola]